MSSQNHTEINVPIPSEPATLDVAFQTHNSTHSVAIESLIQQNIDLSTRLNIHIRRVSDLEQGIQHYQNQFTQFQSQKEAYKEEIQVLHKRFQTQENLVITYRIDKENAEKAYANLVIDHRNLKEKTEKDRALFIGHIRRLEQYHRRIREVITPLFRKYKNEASLVPALQQKLQWFEKYKSKIKKNVRPWVKSLKFDLQTQTDKAQRSELKSHELGARIQELLTHMKAQSDHFEQDQKTLVDYHEKRYGHISKELELYKIDFEHQKQKLEQTTIIKNKFEEANAAHENKTILAERKLLTLEASYQADIQKLQGDIRTVEELWTESKKNAEMLEAHLGAAQRLNQKLSEDMQEARKENELLRLRIRQVKLQAEVIPSASILEVTRPTLAGTEALFQNPLVPQTLIGEENTASADRIEDLFLEIQSGHSKKHQSHAALGSSPLPDREDFGDLL
ncbi:MAG: hypothetical protein AB7F59_01695 [Bdellovibrionales bacterium]